MAMQGQLWQKCSVMGCGTEPVCSRCEECDRHCSCDAAEIEESTTAGMADVRAVTAPEARAAENIHFEAASYLAKSDLFTGGVRRNIFTETLLEGDASDIARWSEILWNQYAADDNTGVAAWLALIYRGQQVYGQTSWSHVANWMGTPALIAAARSHQPLVTQKRQNGINSYEDSVRAVASECGLAFREVTPAPDVDVAAVRESLKHRVSEKVRRASNFTLYRDGEGTLYAKGFYINEWLNIDASLALPETHPIESNEGALVRLYARIVGADGHNPILFLYPDGRKVFAGKQTPTPPARGWQEITVDVTHITADELEAARADALLAYQQEARRERVRLAEQRTGWDRLRPDFAVWDVVTQPAENNALSVRQATLLGRDGGKQAVWFGDFSWGGMTLRGEGDADSETHIFADEAAARKWYDATKAVNAGYDK